MSLKTIANDLGAFLEEAAPAPEPLTEAQLTQLGSTVVNFVMSQIDSEDSPELVGEAVVVGARALAEDAGRPQEEIVESAISVLERMSEAARRLQ
jgi:hypothetical protein